MLDRVTFHVRDGIAVTGVGKIYDPSKRKTRTMAGAVIRLSEYEDTGLDPREIVKLKAERDAAVRDLEYLMKDINGDEGCIFCERKEDCKEIWDEGNVCDCAPEWRGPQQEET